MADASETLEIEYPSSDGVHTIHARFRYPAPDTPVRGVVQLVHGMSEYIERYDAFARFLADRGFIVCGNDHIGHGRSVAAQDEWGVLPLHGGDDVLVEDVHTLRGLAQSRAAERTDGTVPHILFGHSMGSFVVRAYLATHGDGLAGAVVCGTGNSPSVFVAKAGGTLARIIAAFRGPSYRSKLLDGIGSGAYAKQIEDARTDFDWLNTDADAVDVYIADPACGFMFSVGGYATLTDLCARVMSPACAAAVPDDLPVLFIAGSDDPVGQRAAGVRAAADAMATLSRARVDTIIYDGMRHEILNEPDHGRVFDDVAAWLDGVVG